MKPKEAARPAPFTDEMLEGVLSDHVVRRPLQKKPSQASLTRLLTSLNRYHYLVNFTVPARSKLVGRSNELRRDILGALEILSRALPEFLEQVTESGILPALAQASGLYDQEIGALTAIAHEVSKAHAARCLQPLGKSTKAKKVWHRFAHPLADEFRTAMASTNPGTKFGQSDNGPVVRFLELVIPKITGETAERSAIEQFLRRAAAKNPTKSTQKM